MVGEIVSEKYKDRTVDSLNLTCFLCGKEIKLGEDYFSLNGFYYHYDIWSFTYGYKELENCAFIHKKCLKKAKRIFEDRNDKD